MSVSIYFAPGGSSTIIVSQGGTLNITNCNISACGDMWQGIINNGGTVNITNSSTIEDAIEAGHNQNNGILNITNNTFNGNNTDLFLDAGSYSTSKITGQYIYKCRWTTYQSTIRRHCTRTPYTIE